MSFSSWEFWQWVYFAVVKVGLYLLQGAEDLIKDVLQDEEFVL